jgi:hypothetical protein
LSALLILPAAEVVAALMEMAGVAPPEETIGAVPVTEVTPDPVAESSPAERLKPDPIVISSTAPVLAVVLPRILAVACVRPLAVMEPLAAAPVTSATAWVWVSTATRIQSSATDL